MFGEIYQTDHRRKIEENFEPRINHRENPYFIFFNIRLLRT